jgi:SAM-dependent methyltransferase
MNEADAIFSGKKLYGDDFSLEELKKWYEDEKEGYANLGSKNKTTYNYPYHNLNKLYAYNFLPQHLFFNHALGVGSAYGHEFIPIIDRINKITIIEPSDHLVSNRLNDIVPTYAKPKLTGEIDFPDDHFDLIVCFSTLHHIPNVSYVLEELNRCLKPGGYLLIREPINSMGDWRLPRKGLTKNERGIPLKYFRKKISRLNFKLVHESFCFSMTSFLSRLLKRPLYKSNLYLKIDKVISQIIKFRAGKYHRIGFLNKIAPATVVYVLTK